MTRAMSRHPGALAAACVIAGALWSGSALAHAMLTGAVPAVGSTGPAPAEIALSFTEDVEPAFSRIELRDPAGKPVPLGAAHTSAGQKARLVVAVPALPPGPYKVIWHATSTDTHKTQGSFSFSVAP